MRVILFGATGMVGQGVLRECLLDPGLKSVLSIVRTPSGRQHEKLRELVHTDFTSFRAIRDELGDLDACFFCLGVSSAGMSEADYTRVTHDFTLAAGSVLAERNPNMTFIFLSGAGSDSTEGGRVMWGRVKGKTENAVRRLPFRAVFVFRPAFIRPLHGITSRTRSYRILYTVLGPFFPVWKLLFPDHVTTTEQIGRAMLAVARHGYHKPILETPDINLATKGLDGKTGTPPNTLRKD